MTTKMTIAAGLLLGLVVPGDHRRRECQEFEELTMILEVNETDGDAELVISATAEEGLARWTIRDPRGRKIAQLQSSDGRRGVEPVGLRELLFETAEPALELVQAAYPAGTYSVEARTVSGACVTGEVTLTYDILPAPSFSPADGAEVDPSDVVVTWVPVEGAAFYIVEVENDDLDVNITARLPGSANSFRIPAGFLLPGTDYELGVATGTADGNVAFAEVEFSTAE